VFVSHRLRLVLLGTGAWSGGLPQTEPREFRSFSTGQTGYLPTPALESPSSQHCCFSQLPYPTTVDALQTRSSLDRVSIIAKFIELHSRSWFLRSSIPVGVELPLPLPPLPLPLPLPPSNFLLLFVAILSLSFQTQTTRSTTHNSLLSFFHSQPQTQFFFELSFLNHRL
jgi:hypothetical protein